MSESGLMLIVSVCALVVAQGLKFIISLIRTKQPDYVLLVSTGSMPSSHSAVVAALATVVFMLEGFSPLFVVSFVFALIIIHDSFGVRYQAGKHAMLLNEMKNKLNMVDDFSFEQKKLKESLGHKPFEVLVGVLLGIVIAVIGYFIYI